MPADKGSVSILPSDDDRPAISFSRGPVALTIAGRDYALALHVSLVARAASSKPRTRGDRIAGRRAGRQPEGGRRGARAGRAGRRQDHAGARRRAGAGRRRPGDEPTFSIGHRYRAPEVTVVAPRPLPARGARARGAGSAGGLSRLRADRVRGVAQDADAASWRTLADAGDARPSRRRPPCAIEVSRCGAMIVLGFDTATPSTAVGLRLADGTTLQARDDPSIAREPAPGPCHPAAGAGGGAARARRGSAGARWSGSRSAWGRAVHGAARRDRHRARPGAVARDRAGRRLQPAGARPQAAPGYGGCGRLLAVIDARRGEAFAAAYAAGERADGAAPRDAGARGRWPALVPVGAADGERVAGRVGDGALLLSRPSGGARGGGPGGRLAAAPGERRGDLRARRRIAPREAIDTVLPDYRRRPDAEIALAALASGGHVSARWVAEPGSRAARSESRSGGSPIPICRR